MYLGQTTIGRNASIGLGSIVAAGTAVPAETAIGPNSSSWEVGDADASNTSLASSKIPAAHWLLNLLLGLSCQAAALLFSRLSWLGVLAVLVYQEPSASYADPLRSIVVWFASPERVGLHYAALAANTAPGPACFFWAVVTIKKPFDLCCGRIPWGNAVALSHLTAFRRQLIWTLLPAPRLHDLTELFGGHYEATSVFVRAMGAKVGKRVYWPGTGPSIQDYKVLDVGDDVVFGSRSRLVTSDGTGSHPIRVKDGAMVADRVVLLPGVTLGEKTVMGSGALTRRNKNYADASTWVGSKKGEAVCLSATATQPNTSTSTAALSFSSSSRTLPPKHKALDATDDSNSGRSEFRSEKLQPTVTTKEIHSARTSIDFGRYDKTAAHEPASASSPFGRAFYQKQAP